MTKIQLGVLSLAIGAILVLAYLLLPVIEPFLIAALLAYLGNPLVQRLQRWRLPRTLAVITVFSWMLLLIALFLGLLLPTIQRQLLLLINKIPAFVAFLQTDGLVRVNHLASRFGLESYLQPENLQGFAGQHWQQASKYLTLLWQTLSHSSLAIFAWVVNLLLIPVVTFYLLRDWHRLLTQCEIWIPRRYAFTTLRLLSQCDEVLGAFFKGQLMVMLALAALYSLGLTLVGLQLGLLIGLMAGLLSIVPYLGFSIGLIAALLAALLQFPGHLHLIYVLIVFLVGNMLEGMVLTPCLVGDKIGLHPVAVIFAILAGGQLFGFLGILLALPIAAVLMVLLREIRHRYLRSSWAQ